MTIPNSKYVAITSTTANTQSVSNKELIPRVFTTNPLFATNTVYEFTSSANVSSFAGALSAEAQFASEYFGWVSKRGNQAQKISFMRYSLEALAPYIYSTQALTPIATLKEISDGSMNINMGGTSYTISNINFSSIASYSDVASALQTAIQANSGGGTLWTAATVEYQASNNSFILTGGETGANEINYATTASSGTDISGLIGWSQATAPVLSNGIETQTITDVLNNSIQLSTNYLTYGFLNSTDAYNNLALIGAWNNEQNNEYRFCFDVGASNYQEAITTCANYSGLTANYNINYGLSGINPAWIMTAILPATTNYNATNGVKNYMFQEFPQQAIAVGINDDGTLYQTLDNLCINYNGQTQKSGKTLAFYQDGFNTDSTDSAIYDNEAWLKDSISTDILNQFIGTDFISADNDGIATISGILQSNCDKALNNHVFSKGKTISTTQQAYITQLTGDENAWLDIQNNGYKYTIEISTQTVGNKTIYTANYLLIYLKNDVIRKVIGSDILI